MTRRVASRCTRKRFAFSRTRIPDRSWDSRVCSPPPLSEVGILGRGPEARLKAVPTSRYSYRRPNWPKTRSYFDSCRDGCSPPRSDQRQTPHHTTCTRTVRVLRADCRLLSRRRNTSYSCRALKRLQPRCPRFSLCIRGCSRACRTPSRATQGARVFPDSSTRRCRLRGHQQVVRC